MPNTHDHIFSQQLSQILAQSIIPLIGVVVASLITLFLFWEQQRALALGLWFGGLVLVSLGRYVLMVGYRRDPQQSQHSRKWTRRYMLVEMMSGLIWATLLIAIFPSTDIEHILSMLIVGTMMMFGLPVLFFVLPIFTAYTFSLGLAATAILLTLDQIYSHYLALFTLAYMVALWLSARTNNYRNRKYLELAESLQLTNQKLEHQAKEIQVSEQKTRESEGRFRTLANATNEGVLLYENGHIVDSNENISTMLGYAQAQLWDKDIGQLFSLEDEERLLDLLNHNEGVSYEMSGQHANGSTFPVELIKRRLPLDDRDVYVFTLRDISEIKHMTEIKDQFISTVSHELRTPLTSIHASLDLVLGGIGGDLSSKHEELLTLARRNSERLGTLINDLLDVQKLDEGKLAMKRENVDIMTLLQQAVELNQAYVEKFNCHIDLKSPQTSAMVLGDRARLIQVFTNLISNAAKFSPAG
ncbi:MAG: PAS domain-containing sensor histidine kinase, partial [Gammaproteobacteria bacterium]|nr:PAS domain-containing sensor histidine kinase [Gammaproteobacteria bacterium]